MTDPDPVPETFADLPMQPTGSGVADLEVAYEQMKLADGDGAETDVAPLTRGINEAQSEAHPS